MNYTAKQKVTIKDSYALTGQAEYLQSADDGKKQYDRKVWLYAIYLLRQIVSLSYARVMLNNSSFTTLFYILFQNDLLNHI